MTKRASSLMIGFAVAALFGIAPAAGAASTPRVSPGNRAAQSNLVNALTEASAIYQGYGQTFHDIGPRLKKLAPEFAWTEGECAAEGTNCMSFHVVSVRKAGDDQGLILADHASTGTCWYSLEVEHTPRVGPGLIRFTVGGQLDPSAGAWWAKLNEADACDATMAAPDWTWFPSFNAIRGNA